MIGANDVTELTKPSVAVPYLEDAVRALRARGAEVIVGTCPDLGTIRPIAQPLRAYARRLSRRMAREQTVAVVRAGGRTVSLGDLLGPLFAIAARAVLGRPVPPVRGGLPRGGAGDPAVGAGRARAAHPGPLGEHVHHPPVEADRAGGGAGRGPPGQRGRAERRASGARRVRAGGTWARLRRRRPRDPVQSAHRSCRAGAP